MKSNAIVLEAWRKSSRRLLEHGSGKWTPHGEMPLERVQPLSAPERIGVTNPE